MNREPFKSTLTKPEFWDSKKDYFEYCRQSKAFKRVTDNILNEIVENSLVRIDNGKYKLIFPPKWEVSNYTLPIDVTELFFKIKIPIRIIAGKPNIFFSEKLRNKWLSKHKDLAINSFDDYGHLIPFENPKIVSKFILNKLQPKINN